MREGESAGDGSEPGTVNREPGRRRTTTAKGNGGRQGTVSERREEGLTVRRVGSELMVRNRADGRVLFLNETAADVWRLTEETTDIDRITQILCDKYYVADVEVVRAQVAKCVDELEELGLLRRIPGEEVGGPRDGH
jgi:hypothetical protein